MRQKGKRAGLSCIKNLEHTLGEGQKRPETLKKEQRRNKNTKATAGPDTRAPLTDLLYTQQTRGGGLAPSHVEHSPDKSCLPVISNTLTHLRPARCQAQTANVGMDVHTSSGMRTHARTQVLRSLALLKMVF